MAEKKPTFEESLNELEEIISELEAGDLPLDQMIERCEKAVEMHELCCKTLQRSKKRIDILLKDKVGKLKAQPFQPGQDEDGESE